MSAAEIPVSTLINDLARAVGSVNRVAGLLRTNDAAVRQWRRGVHQPCRGNRLALWLLWCIWHRPDLIHPDKLLVAAGLPLWKRGRKPRKFPHERARGRREAQLHAPKSQTGVWDLDAGAGV
jgi:hypothetical protein